MSSTITLHGQIAVPIPRAGFDAVGAAFSLSGSAPEGHELPTCPATLEVRWTEWTPQTAAAMIALSDDGPPPFIGELEDGRFILIEARTVIGEVEDNAQLARFDVAHFTVYPYRPPGYGRGAWLFELLNFQMRCGDLVSEETGDSGWGFSRDAIRFEYANREWHLRDTLRRNEDREHRNFRKYSQPVWAGWLWTDTRDGDEPERLDGYAQEICNLLSFATERSVRWQTRVRVDDCAMRRESMSPSIWCAPASAGGSGPIDTCETGSLAEFLTICGRETRQDSDWWNRTLEIHLQGVLSPIIDVGLTFSYVLLDRLSRRVVGSQFPTQIASDLNQRLDDPDWYSRLAKVLSELSEDWPAWRTAQLVETMKKWNAEPSFPKRVQAATTALGLPEPPGRLISERHLLVHDGSVPKSMPSGIEHLGDFGRAVEALVTAMILRMLGHTGSAYLPDAGRHHDPIHPWPSARHAPWAPAQSDRAE